MKDLSLSILLHFIKINKIYFYIFLKIKIKYCS
jgi:hypothetical protein